MENRILKTIKKFNEKEKVVDWGCTSTLEHILGMCKTLGDQV